MYISARSTIFSIKRWIPQRICQRCWCLLCDRPSIINGGRNADVYSTLVFQASWTKILITTTLCKKCAQSRSSNSSITLFFYSVSCFNNTCKEYFFMYPRRSPLCPLLLTHLCHLCVKTTGCRWSVHQSLAGNQPPFL